MDIKTIQVKGNTCRVVSIFSYSESYHLPELSTLTHKFGTLKTTKT